MHAEISVGFTIVTPGSMDPGMHFGLEVKWLKLLQIRPFEGIGRYDPLKVVADIILLELWQIRPFQS